MTVEEMLCSKQFRSIFNKQIIKNELGILGLYCSFSLKKKEIKMYRFNKIVYIEVDEKYRFTQEQIMDLWKKKDSGITIS